MEEAPSFTMEKAGKIIRLSIHTFLKEFQYFTTTPVLLMLPFSASVLLSLAVFPSSSSPPFSIIHAHLKSLLHAAGFSLSWLLVSLFNLNLSQTICNYLISLPLLLSSFVISKASIIQALNGHGHGHRRSLPLPFSSIRPLYKPLLITHLCNLILNITINMAAMNTITTFVFLSRNPIFLMVTRAVFYIILANMMVIGNLALVVAGMENCIGIFAISKAFLLRKGTNSIALLLALPLNCGLAAIEALFRFRVVRAYYLYERLTASMAVEGLFVAYLYSILLVLETIACCLFFKSCTSIFWTDEIDGYFDIELPKEEDEHPTPTTKLRTLEELP